MVNILYFKNWITMILSFLVLFISTVAASSQNLVKGPYLQNAKETSITIMWQTALSSPSIVEYKLDDELYSVGGKTKLLLHEVEINNLKKSTEYTYRVLVNDSLSQWSQWYNFRTAPDFSEPFRLVVYGDNRSNPDLHREVISSIRKSNPDIVLHSGDLVADGLSQLDWQTEFFDPVSPLLTDVPFFPAIGNHEDVVEGIPIEDIPFLQYFSLPGNERYYAFTYGCCRFIMMNSNENYLPGSEQYDWLLSEFDSPEYKRAKWHFVVFHQPPFTSSSKHAGSLKVREFLVPQFELNGVDLIFLGHNHNYERSYKNGIYYLVTGGGGAPLSDFYANPYLKNPYFITRKQTLHHCVIDISNESFDIKVLDTKGVVFDSLSSNDIKPPIVNLIQPKNEYFITKEPFDLAIKIRSYSEKSEIETLTVYLDDSIVKTFENKAPFEFLYKGMEKGQHRMYAKALDEYENVGISDIATVVVGDYGAIQYSSQNPIVDGKEESLWENVHPHPITHLVGNEVNKEDLSGSFKALWNETSLFFSINVSDDIKVVDSPEWFDWDDNVNIFLDFNKTLSKSSGDGHEFYIFSVSRDMVNVVEATGNFKNLEAMKRAVVETDKGYNMELEFQWSDFGISPTDGMPLGFEIHLIDDDTGHWRDSKLVWWGYSDEIDPSRFGRIILKK